MTGKCLGLVVFGRHLKTGLRQIMKQSITTAGLRAEIVTRNLPNTKPDLQKYG